MSTEIITAFNVIGISVRTTNENMQAAKDIPALWNKFINESILDKIPNKITNDVYCIYTDYEKDYTKPYTTILGCKVDSINSIPDGMVTKTFEEAKYIKHIAKGNILQGLVYNEWLKIWDASIERTYIADFEVYGAKAQNPEHAEVDIFVAVK
jgi:predicted transcriptional regulator YdeE